MAVPTAVWVGLVHPEITPTSNFHQLRDTTGPTIAVMNEVMRQEPAEQLGPLTRTARQDLRNKAPIIVVKHRLRHPPEEGKGMDMAINPGLRNCCRISAPYVRDVVRCSTFL